MNSLSRACMGYENTDPVCFRVSNGQPRFMVNFNPDPDRQTAGQSFSAEGGTPIPQQNGLSASSIPMGGASDMQPQFGSSLLTRTSPERRLCSEGELYNCQ